MADAGLSHELLYRDPDGSPEELNMSNQSNLTVLTHTKSHRLDRSYLEVVVAAIAHLVSP
jgi:hypothetical protein